MLNMTTKLCYFIVSGLTRGMGQKLIQSTKPLTKEWTEDIMHLTRSSWQAKLLKVYYVPYPSNHRRKHGWCAAIKTKPRGQIETEDIIPNIEVAYQDNEMSHVSEVIEVDPITNFVDREVNGQEIDAHLLFNDTEESSSSEDNLEEANNPEDYLISLCSLSRSRSRFRSEAKPLLSQSIGRISNFRDENSNDQYLQGRKTYRAFQESVDRLFEELIASKSRRSGVEENGSDESDNPNIEEDESDDTN
ncbi:hypothetical protein MTR_7g034450 [Medicago truncatula]|uniref:Uncharacterized protein n=1 Tax=Medicago truncatula TaxID=3880 RepID=A0A072TYF0_MEDTR|nr:hypothetical protein MTR_7g034450 [Medicago truncatula]